MKEWLVSDCLRSIGIVRKKRKHSDWWRDNLLICLFYQLIFRRIQNWFGCCCPHREYCFVNLTDFFIEILYGVTLNYLQRSEFLVHNISEMRETWWHQFGSSYFFSVILTALYRVLLWCTCAKLYCFVLPLIVFIVQCPVYSCHDLLY